MTKNKRMRKTRRLASVEPLEDRRLLAGLADSIEYAPLDTTEPVFANGNAFEGALSVEQAFSLESKPGANHTIYIDFDGHVTTDTLWNFFYEQPELVHPPFDFDNNPESFSQQELDHIFDSWQRVAEDWAPFDINVTTKDPGLDALMRTDASDLTWGARAIVTVDDFADCGCGGFAFLNSFSDPIDTPTYVFNHSLDSLALTVSHEVGHMVGLSHDGDSANEYYPGHNGTTPTTEWGAIMGAPFGVNVTTWSNGDYFDSSNSQDDLHIITTQNGFDYRDDDYGDFMGTGPLLNTQPGAPGEVEVGAVGIIERNTDIDFFEFETGDGPISLRIDPLGSRPNLDIWAGIYDSQENLVAEHNPNNRLWAGFAGLNLTAGTYYLRVEGIGIYDVYNPVTNAVEAPAPRPWQANPPSGYSDYGSIGQYTVSGTLVDVGGNTITVDAMDAQQLEGNLGTTTLTFKVTRAGDLNEPVSVDWDFTDSVPVVGQPIRNMPDADDFVLDTEFSGSVDFAAGESEQLVTFEVISDFDTELDEYFDIVLSNQTAGWRLMGNRATGIILTEDNGPVFDVVAGENIKFRWRQLSNSGGAVDNWGLDNVLLSNGNVNDDFDPDIDTNQWDLIQGGASNANFGGSGNSLFFSGSFDPRVAETISSTMAPGDMLSFDFIYGNDNNGGENPESFEEVVLEYQADTTTAWAEIDQYPLSITSWTTMDVAVPNWTRVEGNSGSVSYSFDVFRRGDLELPTSVEWNVAGSGANPANADDFVGGQLPGGELIFAPGEVQKTVIVEVAGDADAEGNETFTFSVMSQHENSSIEAVIVNDDLGDGDFNGDGAFDCLDIDDLVANIAGQTGDLTYDMNGDGQLTGADIDPWLAAAGAANLPSGNAYLRGDADLNGSVGGEDFILWNDNKFTSNAGWCGGDFDADGAVDGRDFILWNENKFTSSDTQTVVTIVVDQSQDEKIEQREINAKTPMAPPTAIRDSLKAPAAVVAERSAYRPTASRAVFVDRALSGWSAIGEAVSQDDEESSLDLPWA